jgi:hypothetical protein
LSQRQASKGMFDEKKILTKQSLGTVSVKNFMDRNEKSPQIYGAEQSIAINRDIPVSANQKKR